MIRSNKIDEYGQQVVDAINELLNNCRNNMFHMGDLLLCHQNGFMIVDQPNIGRGKDGTEYIPRWNTITCKGIGETTEDENFFINNSNQSFNGTSEFELSIINEMKKYQDIWENNFFLRLLTQLVHLLNGEHYDWMLQIKGNKSNLIEHQIIKKCKNAPLFNKVISFAYNREVRNAIAHAQYEFVSGGIILNNVPPQDGLISGLLFEQWEKMYIYSYCLMLYIKKGLELTTSEYFKLTNLSLNKGIPILVPIREQWSPAYLFPDKTGRIWRFNK